MGSLAMGFIFLLEWIFGWISFNGFGPEAGLLGLLGLLSILLLFHALLKYKGQTWAISPLFIKPYQKSGKTPEQGS